MLKPLYDHYHEGFPNQVFKEGDKTLCKVLDFVRQNA